MSHNEVILTDAIKDVIGNEPVLDQFDISYVASFYGTMQDDFVTGTMVREIVKPSFFGLNPSTRNFVTGTRGLAFSVYYAENVAPLSETSAAAIALNPRVSSRLIPPHTLVSYNYRLSQCIDETERYYDTCLPSLKTSFAADGAEVWTYTGSIPGIGTTTSAVSEEDDIAYLFSPYKNVDTTNVGYMFFNNIEIPRGGTQYANDPLTNNHWTWSYPYEGKYNPTARYMKSQDALQVTQTNLVTNKNGTGLLQTYAPKKIDKFFPLLIGKNTSEKMYSEGGRNGLRPLVLNSGLGTNLLPTGSAVDNVFGLSLTVPSDVNLAESVSHSYLSPPNYYGITPPIDAPLTGTTTYNDLIKCLYGFGDTNTMAYGAYIFDLTKLSRMYWQGFEQIGGVDWGNLAATTAYLNFAGNLPIVTSTTGTINWQNSPDAGGWSSVKYDNKITDTTTNTDYNILSSSAILLPPYGVPFSLRSVRWKASSSIGSLDDYVLGSASSRSAFAITTKIIYDYIPDGAISTAYVDITASNPWNFTYDRAVHSDPSDIFISYWAGYPSGPAETNPPIVLIDALAGKWTSGSIGAHEYLAPFETYLGTLLPPGEYRIAFSYVKGTGGTVGNIDRAFVNNFRINELDLLQNPGYALPITSSYLIGGNNYPDFYKYKIDTRYNPVANTITTTEPIGVSGSSAYYQSLHYGVAPIIRGWKYGLYSGLPTHSRCIFRRDRFGQFRDMLEQRPYTRYVLNESATEPFLYPARPGSGNSQQQFYSKFLSNKPQQSTTPGPGPVEVKFVKQRYEKDEKGIGKIIFDKVSPDLTYSQNLSTEVTSSQPYTDGVSRLRDDYGSATNYNLLSFGVNTVGDLVMT